MIVKVYWTGQWSYTKKKNKMMKVTTTQNENEETNTTTTTTENHPLYQPGDYLDGVAGRGRGGGGSGCVVRHEDGTGWVEREEGVPDSSFRLPQDPNPSVPRIKSSTPCRHHQFSSQQQSGRWELVYVYNGWTLISTVLSVHSYRVVWWLLLIHQGNIFRVMFCELVRFSTLSRTL